MEAQKKLCLRIWNRPKICMYPRNHHCPQASSIHKVMRRMRDQVSVPWLEGWLSCWYSIHAFARLYLISFFKLIYHIISLAFILGDWWCLAPRNDSAGIKIWLQWCSWLLESSWYSCGALVWLHVLNVLFRIPKLRCSKKIMHYNSKWENTITFLWPLAVNI